VCGAKFFLKPKTIKGFNVGRHGKRILLYDFSPYVQLVRTELSSAPTSDRISPTWTFTRLLLTAVPVWDTEGCMQCVRLWVVL
jgi:hypothetical protein